MAAGCSLPALTSKTWNFKIRRLIPALFCLQENNMLYIYATVATIENLFHGNYFHDHFVACPFQKNETDSQFKRREQAVEY